MRKQHRRVAGSCREVDQPCKTDGEIDRPGIRFEEEKDYAEEHLRKIVIGQGQAGQDQEANGGIDCEAGEIGDVEGNPGVGNDTAG